MSATVDRPEAQSITGPAQPHATHPRKSVPSQALRVLLVCGVVAPLLYAVAHDVLAAILYDGYSHSSQFISELSSIGAPTRPAVIAVELVFAVLLMAFGAGAWLSAQENRALRVTGGLVFTWAALGPVWFAFPMTMREKIEGTMGTSLSDVMHGVLGGVTYLLIFAALAFGAAALGKRFRLYSILTAVTVLGFGALYIPGFSQIAQGAPTPWLGVFERVSLGAWGLWLAVLAILLLGRRYSAADATPCASTTSSSTHHRRQRPVETHENCVDRPHVRG